MILLCTALAAHAVHSLKSVQILYVKNILGTNDGVAKDAMLKFLLEPLETESEHMDIPEYPQIANNFGNVPYPQTETVVVWVAWLA